jgi:hypothetical protein
VEINKRLVVSLPDEIKSINWARIWTIKWKYKF